MGDFQNLYKWEEPPPPGLNMETHIEPAKVNENVSLETEVEAAVRRLHPHRVGDGTLPTHAWYGTPNQLDPASGQSDGAPNSGV